MWYAGLDRHVQLRRRPGPAQGHRRARHRLRRVPPRAARRAATAGHPGAGVRARAVARPSCRSGCSSGPPAVPAGAVARLYLEHVDPEVYRLIDHARGPRGGVGRLLLKLEPQFVATTMHAELPTMTTLSGQWDGYLDGQDLTGLDRDRVRRLGHDYIGSAVEAAGAGDDAADPALPAQLPGLRGRARSRAATGTGRNLRPQRRRQVDPARGHPVDPVGQGPDDQGADPFVRGGRRLRHRGRVRARGPSVPGPPHPERDQRQPPAGGLTATGWSCPRASGTPSATSSRSSGWTTVPSGRRCSPSRSSWPPSPASRPPSGSAWSCACSASPRSTRRGTWPAKDARRTAARPRPAARHAARRRGPTGRSGRRRSPSRRGRRCRWRRAPGSRVASDRQRQAAAAFEALDRRRQDHEALVIEGRGVRAELETANQQIVEQETELEALLAATDRLGEADRVAVGLADGEREVAALGAALAAATNAENAVVLPEPAQVDEDAVETVRTAAAEAAQNLAGLLSLTRAATEDLDRARQVAARSARLDNGADCPLCGQALGVAFEQVQMHRAAEVVGAEQHLQDLSRRVAQARQRVEAATARQAALVAAADAARRARSEWELADRRARDTFTTLREAWAAVLAEAPGRARRDGQPPSATDLARDLGDLRDRVGCQRAAAAEAERLRIRLERRPALEASLRLNRERAGVATGRLEALREKRRALGFDPEALGRAAAAHDDARVASQAAQARAQAAAVDAATARARQEAAAARLADAVAQHAKLADLESEARHLARAADLLADFRNIVVAAVGPRLAVQASDLFAELTDHEYDDLRVDPETYQLQITDAGKVYGLDRFSGSEIDLANLALRVAISEHVHLQSGGSIGLLVLDEVFGPLDEDRKARMLLALERLRGRFRQILVVTHDAAIKEQLPNAIEVVKLSGRRATARPLTG